MYVASSAVGNLSAGATKGSVSQSTAHTSFLSFPTRRVSTVCYSIPPQEAPATYKRFSKSKSIVGQRMAQDFLRYLASDPKSFWLALWRWWLTLFVLCCFALLIRLTVVSHQKAAKLID